MLPTVVGVDVGATNLQFGVVDGGNVIIGRARGKAEGRAGLERVVANVVNGIGEACEAARLPVRDLGAVGIAAAGANDKPRGVVLSAPNLGWTDVPLRDILEKALPCPVVLDNDVNGAAWGEYRLGAGRGRGDLLGVWVGTGIGGGLVLNDRIYHGDCFTAGEVGHAVIAPDGEPGERTIEDLCSRTGMLRAMRKRRKEFPGSPLLKLTEQQDATLGTRAIADAWKAGDSLARLVVERGAYLLGAGIANWVTVLSLDTVIIGGGITEALGEPYLDLMRESFRADVFPPSLAACELRMTHLAADAAILGAALLARESLAAAE